LFGICACDSDWAGGGAHVCAPGFTGFHGANNVVGIPADGFVVIPAAIESHRANGEHHRDHSNVDYAIDESNAALTRSRTHEICRANFHFTVTSRTTV